MKSNKIYVTVILILLLMCITPTYSLAEEGWPLRADPHIYNVTLSEEEKTTHVFTITNIANYTVSGWLRASKLQCGDESPRIDILGGTEIVLSENRSKKINVEITGATCHNDDCMKLTISFLNNVTGLTDQRDVVIIYVNTNLGFGCYKWFIGSVISVILIIIFAFMILTGRIKWYK